MLLNEEMCRVLVYCQWKKAWWAEWASIRECVSTELPDSVHGPLRQVLSQELAEGLQAFVAEQGDMEDRMGAAWAVKWAGCHELARPIIAAVMGVEVSLSVAAYTGTDSIIELDLRYDDEDVENPNNE